MNCTGTANKLGINGDIPIAGLNYISRDLDATLNKVLGIYRQTNLKLNKNKCLFRCTSILFFSEVIS